jgi:mannose-6-phosphate isomerase class I
MSYIHAPNNRRPFLLRPDNFTPPTRTPWGGRKIAAGYKGLPDQVVGESWEISVEPDFPSVVEDTGQPLAEKTTLLVKLLDAADVLSVQIHPSDDYPGLEPDECGKPESWYVVEADEGGALYIGLREAVSADEMRRALAAGEDVSRFLEKVPVAPGDFFLIEAGTPHAIGAGVMLVEPQRVIPGKRGLTYRYWDWNRRYDAAGKLDPAGQPRALHVEHALAVTRWDAPRGEAFVESVRHRAGPADLEGSADIQWLTGPVPTAPLASEHLAVKRLAGTGSIAMPDSELLWGLTVLHGSVTLTGDDFTLTVSRGRSAVLPAGLPAMRAECIRAHAILGNAR